MLPRSISKNPFNFVYLNLHSPPFSFVLSYCNNYFQFLLIISNKILGFLQFFVSMFPLRSYEDMQSFSSYNANIWELWNFQRQNTIGTFVCHVTQFTNYWKNQVKSFRIAWDTASLMYLVSKFHLIPKKLDWPHLTQAKKKLPGIWWKLRK